MLEENKAESMAGCVSNSRKNKSQDSEGGYSQGVSRSRQTDALRKPTEESGEAGEESVAKPVS